MNNSEETVEEIYVALLGENVDVWRPIKAKRIKGSVYLIADSGEAGQLFRRMPAAIPGHAGRL